MFCTIPLIFIQSDITTPHLHLWGGGGGSCMYYSTVRSDDSRLACVGGLGVGVNIPVDTSQLGELAPLTARSNSWIVCVCVCVCVCWGGGGGCCRYWSTFTPKILTARMLDLIIVCSLSHLWSASPLCACVCVCVWCVRGMDSVDINGQLAAQNTDSDR